jgi:hypothetical protein
MAINYNELFRDLGKFARQYNATALDQVNYRAALASYVKNYYLVKTAPLLIQTSFSGYADVLQALADYMLYDGESVQENSVVAGLVSFSGTGPGSIQDLTATPGQVTPTQMLIGGDVIRLVCSVARSGQDTWTVYSQRRGTLGAKATTGVLYGIPDTEDDTAGICFEVTGTGYAVGDAFYLTAAAVADGGVFQTWLRDCLGRALPASASPTIADSLAEDYAGS